MWLPKLRELKEALGSLFSAPYTTKFPADMSAIELPDGFRGFPRYDISGCVGCGTCVEKCYNKAIYLNDDNKAERMEEYCVGCGVCAYFCPENAISLIEGQRIVRMTPPRRQ